MLVELELDELDDEPVIDEDELEEVSELDEDDEEIEVELELDEIVVDELVVELDVVLLDDVDVDELDELLDCAINVAIKPPACRAVVHERVDSYAALDATINDAMNIGEASKSI